MPVTGDIIYHKRPLNLIHSVGSLSSLSHTYNITRCKIQDFILFLAC